MADPIRDALAAPRPYVNAAARAKAAGSRTVTPYGGSASPIDPVQSSLMRSKNLGSGVMDPTRTAHDPSTIAALRSNFMGPFASELSDELKAFDPRTQEGIFNLATVFFKGPSGRVRAEGPLTTEQRFLLGKLGNVTGGKPLTPDQRDFLRQVGRDAGVSPDTWENWLDRYRHPHYVAEDPGAMIVREGKSNQGVVDMAKIFGVPRGEPLQALRGHVDPPRTEWSSLTDASNRKLGTDLGGEKPGWTFPGYHPGGQAMHYDPRHIGSRADPDVDAMLAGMSDQQRAIVAMIMRSINRRPFGAPGAQHGKLGEPGAN